MWAAEDRSNREALIKVWLHNTWPLAQVQAATEGLKYGLASVNTQQSALKEAEAARVAQMAAVKQREALLKDAELKLSYTKIVAPIDGYVTQKSVETGNQIQTGSRLWQLSPNRRGPC